MGKHKHIQNGDVFGSLQIIDNIGYREYGKARTTYYKCKCLKCGSIKDYPRSYIGKRVFDCGCGRHEPRKIIPAGTIIGKIKVVEITDLIPGRGYNYLCQCSCDKHTRFYARGDRLRSGDVQSCGCLHDNLFKVNAAEAKNSLFVKDTNAGRIVKYSTVNTLQKNNTSGYTGVYWHKKSKKWNARITFQKNIYSLGYFDDPAIAFDAYSAAKEHLYGQFLEWYSVNYPIAWDKMKKRNE